MIKLFTSRAPGRWPARTRALRPFRFTPLLRVMLSVLAAVTLTASRSVAQGGSPGPPPDSARTLAPGELLRRDMKGGESHTYLLRLAPGQYARVVVEQQGVNVVVRLSGPDGALIVESDNPNGKRGPEAVSVVARLGGDYSVEVSADKTQPTGGYELRVEGPRDATAADESHAAAERLFMEAQGLMSAGTTDSLARALEQYGKALAIWREIGDARAEGYTLCSIGQTYKSLGKLSEAVNYFNQALSRLQEAADVPGRAYTLNEMGAAQRDLGDPIQSFEYYSQALELRRSIGDVWGQAQLHNNIGYVYSKIGRQQKAVENLELALPLWRAVGDRGMEMNTLNNIAKAQADMGDLSAAFEQFNEILKYCNETGDKRLEPYADNSLGLIYDTWAESQDALGRYDAALNLFRATKNVEGEAIVLDNIGMVYAGLGDAQQALKYFQDALELRRRLGAPGGEAVTLSNLGYAQILMGNYAEALKDLNLALGLAQKSINKAFEAYSLVRIGTVYAALGDPKRALASYEQALDIQKEKGIDDRRGQAITLDKIGQLYAQMGESSKALDVYEQALRQWATVGDKQGQALTLYGVAGAEMARNNLPEARAKIEEAVGLVESLRYKMSSHQLRMTYFAGKQDFYALAVEIRMRLYDLNHSPADLEAALLYSERARARDLLDILTEARADLNKGIPAQDAERNHRLEQEINSLTQNWLRLRSASRVDDAAAVEKKIRARMDEQEKLQAELKLANPSYALLDKPRPISLRESQQLLDDDTILLEYTLHDGRSYLWSITRDKLTPYTLAGRAEIEKAADGFRQSLTAYEPPQPGESGQQYLTRLKRAAAQYQQFARELSRIVLGPVSSQLGRKRLLIVADEALQYIPFEALPLPDTAGRGRGGTSYSPLVLEHEVVYLPSASALAQLRMMPRRQPSKTLAVIADPVFDRSDERVRASGQSQTTQLAPRDPSAGLSRALRDIGDVGTEATNPKLERLRYTGEEADAITAEAPAGSWMKALGFDASRAMVTSQELGRFSIVHFATHSILNNKHPELSGIVLSMVDEQGQPVDGYLRLGDIYNLDLPVDLVVLSACRTGIGKEVRGEGLLSLTRGFMHAGASKVVASLWKVDDEATAALMKRFYWHMLKEHRQAASALRLAQIDIMQAREQWAAPYYWAGFVLHGDWK